MAPPNTTWSATFCPFRFTGLHPLRESYPLYWAGSRAKRRSCQTLGRQGENMSDCEWCDAGFPIIHNGGPRHLTINDGFVKWWDECKNFGRPNTASTPTSGDSPASEILPTGEVAPSNQVISGPPPLVGHLFKPIYSPLDNPTERPRTQRPGAFFLR
jgi:hypothetical protein